MGLACWLQSLGIGLLMIEADLKALAAPINVVDAGKFIDQQTAFNLPAPPELVQLVREWVSRNRGNNRYGK